MYKLWLEKVNNKDQEILKNLTEEERSDSFYTELSFGTAGIRGKLGMGPNRMNNYQVSKVISGYAKYLNSVNATKIAIAHDNRLYSREFTLLAVNILAEFGIETYAFETLAPTPLLSYTVRELNLDGGVIITASHNPKNYNGIKLYDNSGCQFTPEKIEPIVEFINESDFFGTYPKSNYLKVPEELIEEYVNEVKSISLNEVSPIKATFTPLHGTGGLLIEKILPELNLVSEQMIPDGHFTTVAAPNPENIEAFELALKYAKANDSEIILATDPDADRLGVMVKHKGEYKFLNGNEIAVLILNYILESKSFDNGVVYKSIVTGNLGEVICAAHGVEMVQTLTGFKYIGTMMNESDKEFVYGYEESNGCIVKDIVRDKDALQAVYLMNEAASFYLDRGLTLIDKLDELYVKYGYFYNETISFMLEGQEGLAKKNRVMNHFRTHEFENLLERVDYLGETDLPKDDIVKLQFENISLIVRPSGTEPKVKVYMEAVNNSELIDKYKITIAEAIKNL